MMWSSRGWALLHTSLGKLRPSCCPWLKPDVEPILFSALTHRSWEEQERTSSLCDRATPSGAHTVPCSHSCPVPAPGQTAGPAADRNRLEGTIWVTESSANMHCKFLGGYRNTHATNTAHCRAQQSFGKFSLPNAGAPIRNQETTTTCSRQKAEEFTDVIHISGSCNTC